VRNRRRRGHGSDRPRRLRGGLDVLGMLVMQVAVIVAVSVIVVTAGVVVAMIAPMRPLRRAGHAPDSGSGVADEREESEAAEPGDQRRLGAQEVHRPSPEVPAEDDPRHQGAKADGAELLDVVLVHLVMPVLVAVTVVVPVVVPVVVGVAMAVTVVV